MSPSRKPHPRRRSPGGSDQPPAPPPDLAELQRERDRLSDILRQTTDMVGTADPEGRTLFINRAGRKLLGLGPDEALDGRPIASYSPPWAWEVIRDQGLPAAIRDGSWTGETAMIGAGGEEIPVSQVIIAHRGADGELAYMSTIARDIRDRKRREAELDASRRALQERVEALARSEKKFAAVFRMSPLAMIITTLDEGRFLDANPAFLRRFGYDRDEVIGATTRDLGIWSGRKERRETIGRHLRQRSENRRGEERTLHTKDGQKVEVSFFTERMEIDGRPCLLTVAQDVTERRRTEREMQFLAMYDPLTRLPNRRLFEDRLARSLARAEREGHEVAVLFVDLDRFKRVNDSLGHRAGDRLLEEVAERLVRCFRKVDTVARFGGDEFTALIESRSIGELIELLAGRLRAAFEEPFRVLDTEVHVQASFGLVRSSALEGPLDPDDLLRYADVAMYQAKAAGAGGLHVFDPAGDLGATRRLHTENELRAAIEADAFELVYQPIVEIESGRRVAVEALLRWRHAERGLIGPGEFLALAEESGLIVPLGRRVLDLAAAGLAAWRRSGEVDAGVRLGINVSARELHDASYAERAREAVRGAGIEPGALMLELTESGLLQHPQEVARLRGEGFRLAIDDFGTGYSSFRYLRETRADVLKLDRTFTAGLAGGTADRAIAESMLLLAHRLGMEAVAEGIETEEQRRLLLEIGFRLGQGYLFARPAAELTPQGTPAAAPPRVLSGLGRSEPTV